MERTQVIVIAVVVAVLALFGLRFFSEDPIATELASGGVGDLASAPRFGADEDSDSGGSAGGGSGRRGADRLRGGSKSGEGSSRGEFGRRGDGSSGGGFGSGATGSARTLSGGGAREGSSVGVSGSSAGGRGGGGSGVTLGEAPGGRVGPRAALKDDVVESLGQRQPVLPENQPADGDTALTVTKPEDIPEQSGEAEDIDEADDGEGIKITDRGRVEFPNAGNASNTGTISFQIKPEWAGSDQTDNALVQIRQEHQWNNRLELVKNGEFLRFIVTPDTGQEIDISSRISNWNPNEVHDIQVSWGDGRTTLYIDGQVAGSNTYQGELNFAAGTPMFLGADWRGSNYNGANATLYGFTLNTGASHP